MGRGGDTADWTSDTADWTSDPKDVGNLIRYFYTQGSRFGNGGNPDKQNFYRNDYGRIWPQCP
jgi:hypothetical protein